MTDMALEQLKQTLREGGSAFQGTPTEMRAGFEAMFETLPVPEDVVFSTGHLGGVGAVHARLKQAVADRTLLYLHGGGYVIGSAWAYRGLMAELARATGTQGVAIDYRLAPEHPFPAAVDDALTAYKGLLASGRTHGNIVVAGDSAGGGLTMALLQAIRDAGLPQPAGALLISPWADLSVSAGSVADKQDSDPTLNGPDLLTMARHYLGDTHHKHPLASPVHGDLSGLAPVLIQVGSVEILLDDAIALARALGMANTPVTLEIVPDVPHVWHAFHFMLPQGADAIARAGAFLFDAMGDGHDHD